MTVAKNSSKEEARPSIDSVFRPGGGHPNWGNTERAKNTKDTLLRIWGYLERQKAIMLVVAFLVIITSTMDLIGPYLMGRAIDVYIDQKNLSGLSVLCLWMILTYIISAFGTWLQTYLMATVAQRAVRDLRADLFCKMQTLSLRFFDRHSHGDLMSRLTNDIENINNVISSSATQLVSNIFSMIGVMIMMVVVNIPLAIITMVVIPISYLITRTISKYTRQGFQAQQRSLGSLNGLIEETISGEKIVQAYVCEDNANQQFTVTNRQLQKDATHARIYAECMGPLMNMVNNFSLAIVVGAGGVFALEGLATVGKIATFINYARKFSNPINMLAQLFNTIQSALAGAERVFEVMDETPDIDSPEAIEIPHIHGDVVFDHIYFGYDEDKYVLKNINLHAQPGQLIALVGPTGAGKTTIANLLTRFYEVNGGAIRIDGIDIRDFKKDNLRKELGLVLQDNFLFSDTVMENIRYGRLDATDEEIINASVLANADPFVRTLPHGYQTVLAERGSNLSQGQRQLLAIARALLADPEILILDEATSNVDTRTEKHLQEALLRLMKGRTSFVIAHRLSTIRDADQVLVINDGQVIERGTHKTLLAQDGFYSHLYMSQFKGKMQPTIS